MVQIVDLQPAPSFGQLLGQGVSQGLQDINQMSLMNKMEALKQQKQRELQRTYGKSAAENLAQNLGYKGPERETFVNIFQDIPPEKQLGALKSLSEAQMLREYSGGMGGIAGLSAPQEMPTSGNIPQQEMQQQNIPGQQQGPQQTQAKPIKLGNFEFAPGELPEKTKVIPPFGPLTQASANQESQFKADRKSNQIYLDKLGNENDIRQKIRVLDKAEKLINSKKLDTAWLQKLMIARLTDNESQLAQLVKTPEQIELEGLMRTFLRPKDIGGSNPSTKEVLLSKVSNPDILNPKVANQFLVRNLKEPIENTLKELQLGRKLLQYDPNMSHQAFRETLDKKIGMQEERKPESTKRVVVVSPEGKEFTLPEDKISEAESAGWKRK